jgi:hypothetical protein
LIPAWLNILALAALLAGLACAVATAIDLVRHPQPMWIMNLVWPVAALFGGPLLLCFYAAYGRAGGDGGPPDAPFAAKVGKAALHCGSGCTLGDIAAEWLAFAVPAVALWLGWRTLFADKMLAVWVLDFLFAFLIGVVFQYFTIAPMRHLSVGKGIVAALKADALSLSAWQIGMYGFMALAALLVFPASFGVRLRPDMATFWFMMQIAMLCGLATSYPVNWWLLRRGLKEAM